MKKLITLGLLGTFLTGCEEFHRPSTSEDFTRSQTLQQLTSDIHDAQKKREDFVNAWIKECSKKNMDLANQDMLLAGCVAKNTPPVPTGSPAK